MHNNRFYTTSCEHCGWIGSSEACETLADFLSTDEELICPTCERVFDGEAYDLHLDPLFPVEVPKAIITRLRRNGRAHMGRARTINKRRLEKNKTISEERFKLPLIVIEDFDPIDVYIEHDWTCVYCYKRVDFYQSGRHAKSCVLGHLNNLANSGGHVPANCGPSHYECNALHNNKVETPREGKVDRLLKAQGILAGDTVHKDYPNKKISGRGFEKKSSGQWPKKGTRKIQSFNNLRKRS